MQDKGYNQDFITKLKNSCNIVSVVSKYVPLQRKGRTYWGCCPFHHEKTPSFAVNDIEQYYHCFGCSKSGDVIKFVEEIEGVDFVQAVKSLAESANLEVPEFTGDATILKRKKEQDLLVKICTDTAKFYHSELLKPSGKVAMDYLKKRCVEDETISKMGLGYSPNWQGLIEYLKQLGYSIQDMLKAGVVDSKNGRVYDAMAERLVFPLFNHVGKVVGFSGRALNDGSFAKYKNTMATDIFNKSEVLFGINNLRKARVDLKNYALLVEGQMDVVSLYQAGFTNAIATLGTAFNEYHIKTVSRFVDAIYICFDGDSAGHKAAERSVELLKNTNFDIKVITLPEKLDPDEYIKKYGKDAFENEIKSAKTIKEFKLDCLSEKFDLNDKNQMNKFVSQALDYISSFKYVTERDLFLKTLAQKSSINEEVLRRELNKMVLAKQSENNSHKKVNIVRDENNKLILAETFVLSCRLFKKEFANNVSSELFENKFHQDFNQYLIDNNPIISEVLDKFDIDNNEYLNSIVNFDFSKIKEEEKEYKGCLKQLELRKLYKEQTNLQLQLQTASEEEKTSILLKLQNTIREIQTKKVEE